MKKKTLFFISIFALSFSLIPRVKVFADTTINPSNYNTIIYAYDSNNQRYVFVADSSSQLYLYRSGNSIYISRRSNSLDPPIFAQYSAVPGSMLISPGYNVGYFNVNHYIVYKGSIVTNNIETPGQSYDDWDDYINPPQPELTWYEELFSDFISALGATITGGVDGFLEWLEDAWTVPVGEGENELDLDLITPSPTPTLLPTPTPIPYSTNLIPDGNGGFNIQYIYNDPSGIPTSGPQPPTNEPQPTQSINVNNGNDYPYYDNPNNKDDPYELDIPWYLKFTFKGTTTSLNDFQVGMNAVVDTVNDNDENISVIMDSVGLFPSDWLLLIGFIGGIPLIGGLISRLLKG